MDLYLGAFLNNHDSNEHHFSINYHYRICRIIEGYSQYEALEKHIISAISDVHLDDYNRYYFWQVYENIAVSEVYAEKTKEAQNQVKMQLKQKTDRVKALLPYTISSRIKETEW